jgi:hypothetical protein
VVSKKRVSLFSKVSIKRHALSKRREQLLSEIATFGSRSNLFTLEYILPLAHEKLPVVDTVVKLAKMYNKWGEGDERVGRNQRAV